MATTDANGHYEFTGQVDGDYRVTPTKASAVFAPASRDVAVAAADVVVDDMVGTEYLTLPYTYNMSDVVPSSGHISQLDDWTTRSGIPGDGDIISAPSDSNSYLPTGCTKAFKIEWMASQEANVHLLRNKINPELTSFRFAILAQAGQSNRGCGMWLIESGAGAAESLKLWAAHYGNFNPDAQRIHASYTDGVDTAEVDYVSQGVNITGTRYHWWRWEFNFATATISWACIRAEDSASQYASSTAMSAAGQSLNHVPDLLTTCSLLPQEGTATHNILKFWIGTASDAWPT